MNQNLQTCPIKEVYNSVNHNYSKQIGLYGYKTPKTILHNLYESKCRKQNKNITSRKLTLNRQSEKENESQKNKYQSKMIPSNISYKKPNWNLKRSQSQVNLNFFGKQKKQSSYIPSQLIEYKQLGPGHYDCLAAYNYFYGKDQTKIFPKINKSSLRRRIFSEQIIAKSSQIPGVGQYNIKNCPAVKETILHTQWPKLSRVRWRQIRNKKQLLEKKKLKNPGSNSYNSLPRAYSLFCTMKKQQKSILKFEEYNKKLKLKNDKLKQKKGQKKSLVGPGRYLTLNDWSQKIKDKKGQNFVSRIKTQSVYR